MVPRDYWSNNRIGNQKSQLLKHPTKNPTSPNMDQTQKMHNTPSEVTTTVALQLTDYKKADIKIIAQKCQDLTKQQQVKLLQVLSKHKPLFAGKRGEWKGSPVTITLVEGAKPFWARPYLIVKSSRRS